MGTERRQLLNFLLLDECVGTLKSISPACFDGFPSRKNIQKLLRLFSLLLLGLVVFPPRFTRKVVSQSRRSGRPGPMLTRKFTRLKDLHFISNTAMCTSDSIGGDS